MAPASLLRSARLIHLYFGVFIAPALLFFAFTGALQTFSLHETTRGSSYVPPRWAIVLGQIHKKQTAVVPNRKQGPPETKPSAPAGQNSEAPQATPRTGAAPGTPATTPLPTRHPLPLKIFFLVVSIGLFTSTLTGIYMSYKYNRRPAVISALLLLGAAVPITLVFV